MIGLWLFAAVSVIFFGAITIPWMADLLLKRKYQSTRDWWDKALCTYRNHMSSHSGGSAQMGSRGSEKTAAVWKSEAMRAAANGTLTAEHAADMRSVGIQLPDAIRRTEDDESERFSFSASLLQRIVCGLALLAVLAFVAITPMSLYARPVLVLTACLLMVTVIIDVKAHVIPYEISISIFVLGTLFRFLVGGTSSLMVGLACSLFVWVGCKAINSLFGMRFKGSSAIGGGDIRMMVALTMLCGFRGSVTGALACYGIAAIFSLMAILSKWRDRTDAVPMAPFLAIWAVAGVSVSLSVL